MKVVRIAAIALAALVGLLLVGIAALYAWFDGDKLKAEISRTVLEQKQRTLVIAGKPQLSVWPDVGIRLEGVTLSERGSSMPFAALESARVSVAVMPLLHKQVQVRALDVNGLQATLVKKKDNTVNIADLLGQADAEDSAKSSTATPAASPPAEPLRIDIAAVRLANAQLTWRDEKTGSTTTLSNLSLSTGAVQADTGAKTATVQALALAAKGSAGQDAFEVKLDAPKLSLSPQKSASEAITLSATLQGTGRNAAVNLVLSSVEGNADAVKIGSLALKLDAKAGDATVKGQLSSPVAVNLAGQTVALAKLAGQLDLAHLSMPMKSVSLPISGSLKADALQQTAALELGTQLDESKIATRVKVNKFAPLALDFDLDVNQLNIDKYLPPAPTAPEPQAKDAKAADAPLDFSALNGPSVSGSLRIGLLQVAHLKLSQLQARLALAGGRLDIAPLSLNLYEGSANGSLSVQAKGNTVALKQNLAGVSINPLMKDLLGKDLLEGKGQVQLDISAQGGSVAALKKSLAGSASLALKDGAIKGINLAQTLRDVQAKLGRADANVAANANQKTDFSELSASFKIAHGLAHNDDLSMKSPFIRLGGAGDVDVGQSQINYLAKATVVGSGEGQGGKNADQLKGLTVQVLLSGPFESLSYKIQWGAMLEDVTKAKVEEKKQEIKAKAEEALKDKAKDLLKGLLGR